MGHVTRRILENLARLIEFDLASQFLVYAQDVSELFRNISIIMRSPEARLGASK
jgi:hypothetical protein